MSIKTYYANESEIPENLKGAYVARNGRYELAKLESDHPSIVALDEIKIKHDTLKARNDELLQTQTQLEGKILPDGKIAVDKKEFDTLKTENDAYKTLGTIDDIKPKVEGYDELKTRTERQERETLLDKAFDFAGVTNKKAAFNLKQADALVIESETKDGKEIFYAVSTDDKGKTHKQVFDAEYLKEADGFKDNLPALIGQTGTRVIRQGTTTGGASRAERIRAEVREKEAARGNASRSFAEAFAGTTPAAN